MSAQLDLFAVELASIEPSVALQTWNLHPPCAFGTPTMGYPLMSGWSGPHHCWWCFVETERGRATFAADVRAGKYDAQGYTPAERKAQQRKAAAARPRKDL